MPIQLRRRPGQLFFDKAAGRAQKLDFDFDFVARARETFTPTKLSPALKGQGLLKRD